MCAGYCDKDCLKACQQFNTYVGKMFHLRVHMAGKLVWVKASGLWEWTCMGGPTNRGLWLLHGKHELSSRLGRSKDFLVSLPLALLTETALMETHSCCSAIFLPSFCLLICFSFLLPLWFALKKNVEDYHFNTEGLQVKHMKWNAVPTFTTPWAIASHLLSFWKQPSTLCLHRMATNLSNIPTIFSILQDSVPEIRYFSVFPLLVHHFLFPLCPHHMHHLLLLFWAY